jgi:hypothetical protein
MVKGQKGFSVLEALLLLLAVGIIFGTGWYVWNSTSQANKSLDSANSTKFSSASKPIKTFDDCKKAAGSKVQESYPEVCLTKNGKRFIYQQYLSIEEWRIKIPLSANIGDSYYSLPKISSGNYEYLNLRVHSLDTEPDCKNGEDSVGTIVKTTFSTYQNAINAPSPPITKGGVTIGNYYYYISLAQYDCANDMTKDSLVTNIRKAFQDASLGIVAE